MLNAYLEKKSSCTETQGTDSTIKHKKSDYDYHQHCRHGIFVEPMKWMGNKNSSVIKAATSSEKIYCGKCNSKVGSFGWLSSIPCPCGTTMGPPGFYIQMSRVDRCTMVKEIEASI